MEVGSAKVIFGDGGAQTQCGPIWRKTAHKTIPHDAQRLGRAKDALAGGFTLGVRRF